jgi:S-adenosylmethionine-diacylglycerol 3-amino-3-carboxypropyl transferase
MSLSDRLSQQVFRGVHQNTLVYNTCWEDPRLDREALQITAGDRIAMITSAGCNALDYALLGPEEIHAVDVNPRQNALCELKIAAIRALEYEDFFEMFGKGALTNYREIWNAQLRHQVSPFAQRYWDRNIDYFCQDGWRSSFYFHGASGLFARLINTWINRIPDFRLALNNAFESDSIEAQRSVYAEFKSQMWRDFIKWILRRDATLSLVGVPRAQRREVEGAFVGGIAGFVESCVESVFTLLPLKDNYFWRVYLMGSYSPSCCPEYLKRDNFLKLKSGLVDRIHLHTSTLQSFFEKWVLTGGAAINKMTLLDHMDWLASVNMPALRDEWQALTAAASANAKIIWRSGGTRSDFVEDLEIKRGKRTIRIGDHLRKDTDMASRLHRRDRVHTYASFHVAEMVGI